MVGAGLGTREGWGLSESLVPLLLPAEEASLTGCSDCSQQLGKQRGERSNAHIISVREEMHLKSSGS